MILFASKYLQAIAGNPTAESKPEKLFVGNYTFKKSRQKAVWVWFAQRSMGTEFAQVYKNGFFPTPRDLAFGHCKRNAN